MNNLQYFTRLLTLLVAVMSAAVVASAQRADYATGEEQLLETLRTAPPEAKAVACKQLAIHGSKEAVPELAKLLADPQLASWSRIALEAIPDPAADAALVKAAQSLHGQLLVGAINSLGVRRTATAVDLLSGRLNDADAEVASAAAVALGRIGGAPATAALRTALASTSRPVRSAVAEGLIPCAERLLADGKGAEAAAIYEAIREIDLPQQRLLEATRGAILARGSDGVSLLIAMLHSQDKRQFQLGLQTIREMQFDRASSNMVMAELLGTAPPRAALVLIALAERPGFVVTPQVLQTATFGDKEMRLAALSVIGRLGDSASIDTVLRIAADSDEALAAAANSALASLPGPDVSAAITSRLSRAEGKTLVSLLAAIGQRRIDATAEITKLLANPDASVRNAALTSLGETVGPHELKLLISEAVAPKHADDAQIAWRALKTASVRMPDRDECAAELTAAMAGAAKPTQVKLLEVLGAVGGPKALEAIGAAMRDGDEDLQDAGSRMLGQWMDVEAGPALLELAKNTSTDKYKIRALRGYIRLARQFVMPDGQRADMCHQALAAAPRAEEQKLVLEVLERYPNLDTLKVAAQATQLPALKADATRITLAMAQQLGDGAEVRGILAAAGISGGGN